MSDTPPSDIDQTFDPDTPGEEAAGAFPWPPGPDESVFDAWGRTWSGAALAPRRFFAALPRKRPITPAILYYLSIGILVAGAQLFWAMVLGPSGDEVASGIGAEPWAPLMDFLLSPVLLLLSLFISAAVVHVLLKLFGGAGGDFSLTTRVFAYAYSPQILGVIPVAGTIAGFVWMVAVAVIGLKVAHGTTTGRAAAAILIPLGIGLTFMLLAELIVRAGGLLDVPA